MGPAALAVAAVGTVLQFAGQMQQASAMKQQARDVEQQGLNAAAMQNYKARQQEQAAGQEVAAAQRAAGEERRRATLMASRGLAVAGASGGGVADPTVLGLIADIEGEGAYRGALDIYQGADRARQLRQGALTSELEGEVAIMDSRARASSIRSSAKAMKTAAIGKAAMSAGGMYAKYGGGGPTTDPSGYTDFVSGYNAENYG